MSISIPESNIAYPRLEEREADQTFASLISPSRIIAADYKANTAVHLHQQRNYDLAYRHAVMALDDLGLQCSTPTRGSGMKLVQDLFDKSISRSTIHFIKEFLKQCQPEGKLIASRALSVVAHHLIASRLVAEGALILGASVTASPYNDQRVRDFSDIAIKLTRDTPAKIHFQLSDRVDVWDDALKGCARYLERDRGITPTSFREETLLLPPHERRATAWILQNAAHLLLYLGRIERDRGSHDLAQKSYEQSLQYVTAMGRILGLPADHAEWRGALCREHLSLGPHAFLGKARTLMVGLTIAGNDAYELGRGGESYFFHGMALSLDPVFHIALKGVAQTSQSFPLEVAAYIDMYGPWQKWLEAFDSSQQSASPHATHKGSQPVDSNLSKPTWSGIRAKQNISLDDSATDLFDRILDKYGLTDLIRANVPDLVCDYIALNKTTRPEEFALFLAEKREDIRSKRNLVSEDAESYLSIICVHHLFDAVKHSMQKHAPSEASQLRTLLGEVSGLLGGTVDQSWIEIRPTVRKALSEIYNLKMVRQLSSS